LGFGGMAAILRLTGPDPQPTTAGPTDPEVAAAAAPGLAEVEALLDAQDPRGPERLDSYLIAHPDDPDAWRLQGEVLTERRGDLAAGVQAFKKSLELGPTLKAYVGLGVSLTKLGRMTEAQEPLDQAVRLDPQSGYALTAQAFLLHEQGMFEGALAAIERAIDLEPERAGSHDLKGRVLQALGDVPGAEAAYRRSLALEPSAPTYTNLAAVLCKAERFDEARRATAQAVELEPQSPRTHDAAGMVEYYAGRFEQAIVHFDDALALDPTEVPTLINRGFTHKRLGHAAAARADLEAVLAHAPEGDPARDTARKGLQGLGVAAAR
ncbi:MAG: tetratricopeptide repeat protein, partial [Planctomycetota bacterium]